MAHDTDTSTSASSGIKSHKLPLNNHLHKINAVVSLMPPSASYDRKHVIAMYAPKPNMPLEYHIKPHVPNGSCTHETAISIYASYEPKAINNVTRNTDIHACHITGICP